MTGTRPARTIRRVDVLGVRISAVTLDAAVDRVAAWIAEDAREYVCVSGVHGVMESFRDPELRAIHNAAGMAVPDGMPMVWSGRLAGAKEIAHVRGADLMLATCRRARDEGWPMYLYGGGPDVPARLSAALTGQLPGLRIAGSYSPPFRPLTAQERTEVAERINASGAKIVWVGLSTPKQERWMHEMRPLLTAPVLLGVGAAFDMHAGTLKQAPALFQRSGLEWAYRLVKEPRRLWRRYLVNNTGFLRTIVRRPPRLVSAPDEG